MKAVWERKLLLDVGINIKIYKSHEEKYGTKQSVLILCAWFITQFSCYANKIAVDPRNPLMPWNDPYPTKIGKVIYDR